MSVYFTISFILIFHSSLQPYLISQLTIRKTEREREREILREREKEREIDGERKRERVSEGI